MSIPFLNAVDLNKNELRQAVLQNLASAPATPSEGQVYYDTTLDKARFWDGSQWQDMVGGTGVVTSVGGAAPITSTGGTSPEIGITAATTSAAGSMSATDKTKLDGIAEGATANSSDATLLARANHTGTQAASTISDFAEAVSDQVGSMVTGNTESGITVAYDDADNTLDFTVTDSPTVAGQTPAQLRDRSTHTGTQLSSTISDFTESVTDLVGGMVTGNTETGITVTFEDSDNTLDFAVTDSPLLGGQNSAWHRSRANHTGTQTHDTISDFDTEVNALVSAGISALVDSAPGTLDTLNELAAALGDDPNFATTVTNGLNAKPDKYAANIGNGALTTIPVTHSLGTRDVTVMVYQNGSPYAQIFCDVEMTDANTVTLKFATAPASSAYRVVVIG